MPDTFGWVPTVEGLSGTATLKVRKAQFGDGYRQTSADGINSRSSTFNLQFKKDATTMAAILAFLDAHAGVSFYWSPLLRGPLLFTCETYGEPTKDGDIYTLTATFEQTFAP